MNVDNLILLNETIVEKLLDSFGDDFHVKRQFKGNKPIFEKHMKDIFQKQGIQLIFIKPNEDPRIEQRDIGGEHHAQSNTIIITYPRRGVKLHEIMSVIFHEYAHYIKRNLTHEKFEPNKENSNYTFPINSIALDNPYGLYGLFLEKKNSEFLMNKMLKYWTQPHERTNIAFSIAYDIYYDVRPFKSDEIEQLINSFQEIWKKYYKTNQHEEIGMCLNNLHFSSGAMILLSIIFYRQELTLRRELARELVLSVPRTIELIKKYYKRIGGILNTSQNW
jgi:hypothetical protein